MLRVFKNKWFNRWTRREGLADDALLGAAQEIASGKVEAELGGYLFKKRIARGLAAEKAEDIGPL